MDDVARPFLDKRHTYIGRALVSGRGLSRGRSSGAVVERSVELCALCGPIYSGCTVFSPRRQCSSAGHMQLELVAEAA